MHGGRGGGERDKVKEGERWRERVIGKEREKGRGREIGRDGVR